MGHRSSPFRLCVGILTFCLGATSAHTQTRMWVSGAGRDANPCSRTEPCQTFAGAIAKSAAGGEVNCLDPGEFGAMIIDKSITIDCHDVGAPSTTGIYINAAATDTISLRGLNIESTGTVTNTGGIAFTGGGSRMLQTVSFAASIPVSPSHRVAPANSMLQSPTSSTTAPGTLAPASSSGRRRPK
jgi:hypothetical protein